MGEIDYFRACETIRLDLLDLYGKSYVIDHCVALFLQRAEEKRYRAYLTDALMVIAENTARFAGGRMMNGRWMDSEKAEDQRSGDEIAGDFLARYNQDVLGMEPEGGE